MKLARMINQAQLKSNQTRPIYKYGFQVPRNHNKAVKIDEKNGNTLWQDSEELEKNQLYKYTSTFEDQGLNAPIPESYTKIPTHFVYDVKHDWRHKSRMIAGGHCMEMPVNIVYSGVVTLAGVRIVTFLAEHNDMELWGMDIGNAYLESYTKEKVCFTAGLEFGEQEGHTFVIKKALYGLQSSGAQWHDRLYNVGIQGCMRDWIQYPVPMQDVRIPVMVVMWPLLGDVAKPGHFCHIWQFLPL
jgi:hypothetical protein